MPPSSVYLPAGHPCRKWCKWGNFKLISNDKFKSVEHRVVANCEGPRVSVACFFSTSVAPSTKLYGPIKELLSEDNPPKYRETTVQEVFPTRIQRVLTGLPRCCISGSKFGFWNSMNG
ncbi:unnamed protein product [Fraxinus pennsylvanica]|uniref:Isopenicillin N synthase-like Fe(2+) 2OG dioxygenase domain-containing protein n=1 Tax=Fraxinus pennsylvanica TaxID=56036 RepID=A0AAD1ZX18_9LAMI|nr:unnamed protein product [Fraxinus pennsylvanica]